MTTDNTILTPRLRVDRDGRCLTLRHPLMTASWNLAQGGRMVFLEDQRNGLALLDARAGGPGPDLLVAASATLEEDCHDIRMSDFPAEVEVLETPEGDTLRLIFTVTSPEVRIERHLTVRMDSAWIEERVFLQNMSDHDLLIDRYPDWEAQGKTAVAGDLYHWQVNPGGVDYLLEGLRIGGDYAGTEYVTPACGYPFFYNRGHFSEMNDTAITLVGGHHGAVLPCIMAYHEEKGGGLLLSCLHDRCLRYVRMYADQAAQMGTVASQVWWARWLSPRERQEVATWHLVPFAGDYSPMLNEYRHWLMEEQGITPPTDGGDYLNDVFVGSFHPILMNGLGSMDALVPYIDRAAEVGITALWASGTFLDASDIEPKAVKSRCMPVTDGEKYTPTHRYGGPEARTRLVDYIHSKGMKLVIWVTGYGLTGFDPIYQQHPEAFVRLRKPVHLGVDSNPSWPGYDLTVGRYDPWIYPPFGGATIGGDTTNPVWRKFWLHNQEYWAGHGVDGIFFDSFNPMPPNYALRPWPGQISLEIINLQREARRLAKANNPEFFTFTEGGGYLMSTVNDFTHTWHGSTAPPLPPYRTRPLTPEEEARFLRDETFSMLPGARAWAMVNDSGDNKAGVVSESRPRVLYNMFSGRMPVLGMYGIGAQPEPINNETDYWAYWKPYPADQPHPAETSHWEHVKADWQLRQAHPELRAGTLAIQQADDPAVHAFLRRNGADATLVVLNFRREPITCTVKVDLDAAGIAAGESLTPRELLTDQAFPACTGAELQGYTVTIPARDGLVIKLK
ncbi:MAG: alpha-glucosidase C-terminal domain-containing protein [Armatimonadota bacterium]